MAYKIVSVSNTLKLVRPGHWWSDFLTFKDLIHALDEIESRDGRVMSVTGLSHGWAKTLVVVTNGKSDEAS